MAFCYVYRTRVRVFPLAINHSFKNTKGSPGLFYRTGTFILLPNATRLAWVEKGYIRQEGRHGEEKINVRKHA
jgi:hypothetical protein